MRHHPISPVTEPMQYRAIGVVRGTYRPSDPEQLTRGVIQTADGSEIEAVVLGRVLTLMRRHLDLAQPHLWVVYPRSRDADQLHLQLVGVWEPSTLAAETGPETGPETGTETGTETSEVAAESLDMEVLGVESSEAGSLEAEALAAEPGTGGPEELEAAGAEPVQSADAAAASAGESLGAEGAEEGDAGADAVPEGDDYFSVRGELIYTRPESGDVVVKIRQQPRPDGSRPTPFKLQLKGEIPLESLRHFVSLDLRRQGQFLQLERHEVIAPMPQRGNRGGKGRGSAGKGGGASRGAGGSRQGAERGEAGSADRARGDRNGGATRPETRSDAPRGDAPRGASQQSGSERGGSGRGPAPARGNSSAVSRPSR